MPILGINKPPGVTSHQVALRLSGKWKTPVTHSGTLDPMAGGVMVLLLGPRTSSRQTEYQAASKKYRFDILFGFSTDTFDGLGLVSRIKAYSPTRFPAARLVRELERWTGRRKQTVPPFSARVIRGKPLFWWAREGRLKEIGKVTRKIKVYSARVRSTREISGAALKRRLFTGVRSIEGDFRQEKILHSWSEAFEKHPNRGFIQTRVEMEVSGGTYVRSIAHETGAALGIPAFALSIQRIQSGDIRLRDCIPFEEALRSPSPSVFL